MIKIINKEKDNNEGKEKNQIKTESLNIIKTNNEKDDLDKIKHNNSHRHHHHHHRRHHRDSHKRNSRHRERSRSKSRSKSRKKSSSKTSEN